MYNQVFIPAIKYNLAGTSLTESQYTKLQQPIKNIILTNLGFNYNTPNVVVYTEPIYGGIGLHNIYIEQGIADTIYIIKTIESRCKWQLTFKTSLKPIK